MATDGPLRLRGRSHPHGYGEDKTGRPAASQSRGFYDVLFARDGARHVGIQTGGGRKAAAGINDLPADQLSVFVDAFAAFYR